MEIGDRVGAILGQKDKVLEFLGYGTYEGREVPETAIGWMAEEMRAAKLDNPKIRLDNGKVVWGCECWWGAEAAIKKTLDDAVKHGATIVDTDIDEVRQNFSTGE